MYTVSDGINALTGAGLCIECYNGYDALARNGGGMKLTEEGLHQDPSLKERVSFAFSVRAKKH